MKINKIFMPGWLFFLILLTLNSCTFSKKTCRQLLEDSMKKKYDVVIVPGVPFENGKWSWVMKGRVYWSKYLYDKGITKNVIYSGAAVYSPYYESKIMALYAEQIGIQKENIFIDTLAQHSTENVYYSYKKARSLGFESIALASDPFQTKMLKRFTRKVVSPDVGLIPFDTDTLLAIQPEMIDPEIDYQKAFVKDFISLPQRKNFLERFKGTEGKDIDTSAYSK